MLIRHADVLLGVIFVGAAYLLGGVLDQYLLSLVILVLGNIVLAISWNIAASAGLISLGQTAFWGLGGYAAAVMQAKLNWPLIPTVIFGALIAVLGGLVIGVITTRLRQFYFAISTLAFAEVLRVITIMVPSITEGANGLFLLGNNLPSPTTIYYLMATTMTLTLATSIWINRSRVWYALTAMREDEDAARMLGINPYPYRLFALCIGALFSGAAGAIGVYLTRYIAPETGFSLAISVQAQVAPIAGGLYTVAGPIVGSLLLAVVSEALRTLLPAGANVLVYGLSLIICILFLPRGIVGAASQLWARQARTAPEGLPEQTPRLVQAGGPGGSDE